MDPKAIEQAHEGVKVDPQHLVGHVTALAALLGTLAKVLPLLATLITIVWYGIMVWESQTARELRGRWGARKAIPVSVETDEHSDGG